MSKGYDPKSPEMSHVRTNHYPNGNQGFSERNLGTDTIPGPAKGAPLSNRVEQTVTSERVLPHGMNPFNKHEGNEAGVLSPFTVAQDSGRYDGPVPMSAVLPNKDIKTKAAEVSMELGKVSENDFPSDGVMHR